MYNTYYFIIIRTQQYRLTEYTEDHLIQYNSILHLSPMVRILYTFIPFIASFSYQCMYLHWLDFKILVAAGEPEETVQTGIELGSECMEPRVPTLPNG